MYVVGVEVFFLGLEPGDLFDDPVQALLEPGEVGREALGGLGLGA